MSILDSTIAPFLTLLTIFAVLAGFFRKTLLKVLVILVAAVLLLAMFPILLLKLTDLIQAIRHIF